VNPWGVASVCLLGALFAAPAQARPSPPQRASPSAAPKATGANYPGEPFLIDTYSTVARLENDGTGEIVLTVRIQIRDDAGVRQLSELVFPYSAPYEEIDVRYLRLHTPEGALIPLATGASTDRVAAAVRDAPAYGFFREKHIAVPGLAPGVVVEYEIVTRFVKAAKPGEFWFRHAFIDNAIVLAERL
jgi:hypothetical protein